MLRMSVRLKERERDFQQTPQIISWICEHMGMTQLAAAVTSNCLMIVPGFLVLKARITVKVLSNTVATVTMSEVK